MPNDPMIHQFRALVLVALQRYDEAAAALYSVLSVGPGWDWTTLISLYPDVETYTAHLRALEQYTRTHPDAAAPRFVLAYLYLTAGQNDAAADQLKIVTRLQPEDRVSAQILQSITKAQAAGSAPVANATTPAGTTRPPAESAPGGKLEGTWTAQPDKSTTITLGIAADGKFTWKVSSKGQSHQLAGRSSADDGILTLVQAEGGPPMVGQSKWRDSDHFTFQALGGGPGDPGLSFTRSSR
jgi:hypothetical protein